jgi:uncharacterized protein YbjT (DUF2867 family)
VDDPRADLRGRPRVVVTGATGYVGGRLVPRLLDAGYRVRCVVPSVRMLAARPWISDRGVEFAETELTDVQRAAAAMRGSSAAYYLAGPVVDHGLRHRAVELAMAEHFTIAAAAAGIGRIVWLGPLRPTDDPANRGVAARRELESVLASGPVRLTALRAGPIIGAGSPAFEILRYLVERLPVMLTGRWIDTRTQPIAIENVLRYLVSCLKVPSTAGRALDIGGPEVTTCRDVMRVLAEELGLRRRVIVSVPGLAARATALSIRLVTPLSHRLARPVIEGLRHPAVCDSDDAARLMPQPLLGVRDAIRAALPQTQRTGRAFAGTGAAPMPGDPEWAGGTVLADRRRTELAASPSTAYRAVIWVGVHHGWYGGEWFRHARAALDRLVPGRAHDRPIDDSSSVVTDEPAEFWRLTAVEPDRRVVLRATTRLPGDAQLEFVIEPLPDTPDRCRLVQTARFRPRGLAGLTYWYGMLPFHRRFFDHVLDGIRRAAEGRGAPPRAA